uniref:Cocaine- and amphetamine-regulated transcript protein n=1 Tax=Salmo trutta TaxID=8032 RepID=A0A674EEQ9_SALTR
MFQHLVETLFPIRTMVSFMQLTRAVACALLMSIMCAAETSDSEMEVDLETINNHDFYTQKPNLPNEKRLLGALHEVLEKLQTKIINPWENTFGQGTTHDMGEHCAVSKGAPFCNLFLLKCL